MRQPKDTEIKIRVTSQIKYAIKAIADSREDYTESQVVRDAIYEYLARHGVTPATSKPPTKPHSATSVDISPLAAVLNDAIGEPSQSLPQNSPATPHTGSTHKGVSYPKPGQSNAPKRKRAHKGSKQ